MREDKTIGKHAYAIPDSFSKILISNISILLSCKDLYEQRRLAQRFLFKTVINFIIL